MSQAGVAELSRHRNLCINPAAINHRPAPSHLHQQQLQRHHISLITNPRSPLVTCIRVLPVQPSTLSTPLISPPYSSSKSVGETKQAILPVERLCNRRRRGAAGRSPRALGPRTFPTSRCILVQIEDFHLLHLPLSTSALLLQCLGASLACYR